MSKPAPEGFLGLSHLGIISSIGWASFGNAVIAVDLDPAPVEMLRRGELPVHEPSLDELLAASRGRMAFSSDPAVLTECPLVIIARDVPTNSGNVSDTSVVLALIDAAIPYLQQDVTLALMSQVPPGFTRGVAGRIRDRRPELRFKLFYWVETLIFGSAVERYLKPERIIIGCHDPQEPFPPQLDAGLHRFGCPVLPLSYESAELTKTAINLYLCSSVTYANTLSDLCEAVGANWSEMMPALRLDRRIGPAAYIRPSLGITGGNLERDMVTLRTLCREHGVDGAFIESMIGYNTRRYEWVNRKLHEHVFSETAHPVIAVWGLAYKKNTRSTKNSIALRVIGDLQERAEVRAYDPVVSAGEVDLSVKIVDQRDDALVGADCLLVLTDWDEFAAPSSDGFRAMRHPVVIDGVGVIDPGRADLKAVRYVSMGRPA